MIEDASLPACSAADVAGDLARLFADARAVAESLAGGLVWVAGTRDKIRLAYDAYYVACAAEALRERHARLAWWSTETPARAPSVTAPDVRLDGLRDSLEAQLARTSFVADGDTTLALEHALALVRRASGIGAIAPSMPSFAGRPARAPGLREGKPATRTTVDLLHTIVFQVEIAAVEVCSRIWVEHPEAPWALHLDMARQVFDEARHAEMLLARLEQLGGREGQGPIDYKVWDTFQAVRGLPARLLVQHRIGEGRGLDACEQLRKSSEASGDVATARVFEFIMADEVHHVRAGHDWLRALGQGDPGRLGELEAETFERLMDRGIFVPDPKPEQVNVRARLAAGFTRADVAELVAP